MLIAGLTLTAWAGWLVAWRWTGSFAAALVAGALLAFNAHLLTRLAHIPAADVGLPLTIWLADRLLERPTRIDFFLFLAVVLATAITSAYTLALVGVCVAASLAIGVAYRRWTSVALIVLGSLGGLILAAPVLWPYMRFAATGVGRPIEQVADFSATVSGYLTSLSHVHAQWTARFFRDDVNVFFAGVTAIALAFLGVVAVRHDRTARRRISLLLLLAGGGVLLSLGPSTAVYRSLYDWVPPLRGLRAAARFGYLYLAAVGLAAAYGLRAVEQRIGPARRTALAVTALALVTFEAWSGPAPTRSFTRIPGIYAGLAAADGPVLLVEVPFYPADAMFENGEYVLNATGHWKPVMNGMSGVTPMSYRRRAESFWFFPRDWAIIASNAAAIHSGTCSATRVIGPNRVCQSRSTTIIQTGKATPQPMTRAISMPSHGSRVSGTSTSTTTISTQTMRFLRTKEESRRALPACPWALGLSPWA